MRLEAASEPAIDGADSPSSRAGVPCSLPRATRSPTGPTRAASRPRGSRGSRRESWRARVRISSSSPAGDTAIALLRGLGASRLELTGAPASGLALGDVIVDAVPVLSVLTKAGGFGAPDLFSTLLKGLA